MMTSKMMMSTTMIIEHLTNDSRCNMNMALSALK